jgi:hypothetical protein
MKKSTFLKTVTIALGALFLSSAINAADFESVKYSYRGDKQSQQVCKSVVKDDAAQLEKLLKREKLRLLSLKPVDHIYTCNKMNLHTFAVNVNAVDSQKYLISLDQNRGIYSPKTRIYIDDVASR